MSRAKKPPRAFLEHSDAFMFGDKPEDHLWRIDWRKHGRSGVYVIAPEANWPCKIGVSAQPTRRVADMQTAHWKLLVVTAFWHVATQEEAMAIEARAHENMIRDEKLMLGEWFNVRPGEAAAEVARAADELNISLGREFASEDDRRKIADFIWQRAEEIRIAKMGWRINYRTGKLFNR